MAQNVHKGVRLPFSSATFEPFRPLTRTRLPQIFQRPLARLANGLEQEGQPSIESQRTLHAVRSSTETALHSFSAGALSWAYDLKELPSTLPKKHLYSLVSYRRIGWYPR